MTRFGSTGGKDQNVTRKLVRLGLDYFYPDDGSNMFLRNINRLPIYTGPTQKITRHKDSLRTCTNRNDKQTRQFVYWPLRSAH